MGDNPPKELTVGVVDCLGDESPERRCKIADFELTCGHKQLIIVETLIVETLEAGKTKRNDGPVGFARVVPKRREDRHDCKNRNVVLHVLTSIERESLERVEYLF